MNVINSVVLTASSISSMVPLIGLIIFVGGILVLLVKIVQGEEAIRQSSMTINATIQVPRLKMTRVHIPFTFRLLETGNNSYEEVKLAVSSHVKYSLQAFWAVSIRELHMSLWRPWTEISEAACSKVSSIVDSAHCQQLAIDLRNQEPHSETTVVIKSPKPPLVLGSPPRLAYPLVVFLIRETEADEISHPDDTVLLINVVHLKDPVCPLPTSQLYMAAGENESEGSSMGSSVGGSLSLAEPVACAGSSAPLLCSDTILREGQQSEQLCVVCHYFPLSRALLPCRHTCICAICFSKLERCPMCRAPINSYFCIRSEEYVPVNAETRAPKSKAAINWIDALNDRLTDFLGFR
ncbi:CLUMA_CG013621, isoform A [Clunio marinus]|uniref:CLUMA_CG013621, isoform A n=1 Tax=Clunio marinus TaxID=568069 RepID=A0A1J1IJD1_9DIPT|nr:CLUMA_CG013621, isoform A [Clunio marinus]